MSKEWSFDWEHEVYITTPGGQRRKETSKCYEVRMYYQNLGPTRTQSQTAKHFNLTQQRVSEIAIKYGWDDIISEMNEYYSWLSHITLKEAQDNFLEQTQSEVKEELQWLRLAIKDLSIKLGFIPNPDTGKKEPDESVDYIKGLKAYKNLVSSLKDLRSMAYRAVGLADKLNAPQTTHIVNNNPIQDLSEFVEDKSLQDEILNDF